MDFYTFICICINFIKLFITNYEVFKEKFWMKNIHTILHEQILFTFFASSSSSNEHKKKSHGQCEREG